jgi:inosose dehydratase
VLHGHCGRNPPWAWCLITWLPRGIGGPRPIGFLPENVDVLRKEQASRGLSLMAGVVCRCRHEPGRRVDVLRIARRVGRILSAFGARAPLVVSDLPVPARQRTAGRGCEAEQLTGKAWDQLIRTITAVAGIALDFAFRAVLHPRCGSRIEFADEIERALTDIPPEMVGLCVDAAQGAVAGLEAADLVARYSARVEYLHLKDVEKTPVRRMVADRLTFDEAGVGLFCPAGWGMVDFVALRSTLYRVGFAAAAAVEHDPGPGAEGFSRVASARSSLEFLREVGLVLDDPARASDRSAERRVAR